jgi:hypothetical protein
MVKHCPRRTAVSFLDRTRRVIEWLRSQPPLAGTWGPSARNCSATAYGRSA